MTLPCTTYVVPGLHNDNHLIMESISELQRKEKSLQEENKVLQKELAEKQKAQRQQAQWDQTQQQTSSSSSSFVMKEAPPVTNISNYPVTVSGRVEGAAAQPQRQPRVGLPPWMLSHLSS
ncbi:unnamed protein product [Urochloa humidicola]